ncbi:MAG TPA: imidazolonepropionase, partial [bacterium]|nr:imidazolonepropionase [bacterium]
MEPCDGRLGPLGVIADAAVRVRDGRIVWLGLGRDLPSVKSHEEVVDAQGGVVMPGLVDCHTHL